jgi:hypothetical protein
MMNPNQKHFHRYRIKVIEQWPESEYKRAALSSAQAALKGESAEATTETESDATVPEKKPFGKLLSGGMD